MNTKLIFLLAALTLLTAASASLVNNRKKSFSPKEVAAYSASLHAPDQEKADPTHLPDVVPHKNEQHKRVRGGNEEDGKHHHFHFGRVNCCPRRRILFIVLSKLLLIVMHLSLLVYMYTHVCH